MLLSTHKRIAEIIAKEIGLNLAQTDCLIKGLIKPDYWRDFPHHYGKERHIRKYIIEARMAYLEDNATEALFNLGVALHYIQDAWVMIPGWQMEHGWYEEEIDRAPLEVDLKKMVAVNLLNKLWRNSHFHILEDCKRQYFKIVKRLAEFERLFRRGFKGYDGDFIEEATLNIATLKRPSLGSPFHDFNFACRISLLVALSIFLPKTSRDLQNMLSQLRKEYKKEMIEAEKALAEKLIELKKRRDKLKQIGGIINIFRKTICDINIWINKSRYENQSHLLKVQNAYYERAELLAHRYENWYIVEIPELRIEEIAEYNRGNIQSIPK